MKYIKTAGCFLLFSLINVAWAAPVLTVNGVSANYTTSKFFVDEIAGDTVTLNVVFTPNAANVTDVEVFTNLDRRDFVDVDFNSDGIPDGIKPPDGNTITTAHTGAYFRAYTMTPAGGGSYTRTFTAGKCGAYRLTARYKVAGNPNWIWYSNVGEGRRDHAIVISPKKTLQMTLYELHTLTANASWNDQNGRGVFAHFSDLAKPVNFDYFDFLNVNCLWFQPIHPVGVERTEIDPATSAPYQPGSPYATRDYFAVAHTMGTFFNEANAMDEFTNFVKQADMRGVHVMLDGVFNHTSWDARMGQGGVDLGFVGDPNTRIGAARPGWYSRIDNYCEPATFYNSAFDNNFATAPDRGDFGKWNDVAELYFGRYASLVCHNPQDNGNYLNEGDWYDYNSMTPQVVEIWKYFGYYTEFWLKKTGHPGTNSFNLALDDLGIDALRCDFGQGLPPQFWEYAVNRTRSMKWNFVFMAETLDGGVPGYRSNRHFDILNENLVFNFTQAHVNNSWDIRNALEARRNAYSGGAILLNLTSHDEVMPDNDPWVTATRYGALSIVDGLPMIFYGQERGIQNYNPNSCCWFYDGFRTDHELNFGKYVPHFKKWNQLTVFSNPPPFAGGMDQWHGYVNRARLNSPALQSRNRYFLSRMAGGENAQILAVAKYQTPGGSPATHDVVLGFANLLRHGQPHTAASDVYDLKPVFALLGLDFNRNYNVRNLASSNPNAFLWGAPKSGLQLWNEGIFVSLKADTFGSITDDGSLVQYLKIVDVGAASSGTWNYLGIPGAWSGWEDPAPPWRLSKVSPPGTPAARDWYTNCIHVAASGGDVTGGTYAFKLRANGNWSFNWGGGATVNMDAVTTLGWIGADASVTLQNNAYYSFRVLDPAANEPAQIAVMKTSAKPVGVTRSGATPLFPRTNESVTVSITLSAAKSPEEKIYVRYTTNEWASSSFVLATGSGTSYTAVIPAQPNGVRVRYYVLSTTGTPNHNNADALTLNLDTNGGVNFTYLSAALPWPGGEYSAGYPSSPAERIRHDREEAVVGNGFITAMLDRNGSLYDLYFPSAGLRSGSGTANEGYRGPQTWPQFCLGLDEQANGQMNLINGTGGIGVGTNIWWLTNLSSNYVDVGQRWLSDDTLVVVTSNRLNATGFNIAVKQYDFVPAANTLPVVTDGTRTNRGVYVKRFLLTNHEASAKTFDFYWDVNFIVKGDNAHDEMFWDTSGGRNMMIVRDIQGRQATGTWCSPDGYGSTPDKQYDPAGEPGGWAKSNSVYFATVMKLVTNTVTGAGVPADGSWRDHTGADNHEGWIGKRVTIPAGQTVEVDVMIVGSWDDAPNMTGTHTFWGVPLVDWFYANNMADVQAATAAYWSNWLAGGVTVNFPDPAYNQLFKRSLLVSALHVDPVSGGIIAGMHNGAYPFVWPRDGVYAAVTFARAGHTNISAAFYRWLENAERAHDTGIGDKGFFYQKYTTDGKPVWRTPQVDETASIPWGLFYHYLVTGDLGFLNQHWNLTYTSARASSEDSAIDTRLFFNDATRRMHSNNVWEDQFGEFLYSNASVVRGLRDAAEIADLTGNSGWATTFRNRADDIHFNGIIPRIDARTETSDISQMGLVVPFELFAPNDARMTNMVEWLHGRQSAGGFTGAEGNLVEMSGDIEGLLRRYNRKTANNYGDLDNYWGGGPWFLATSWYGMYYARWQDHVAGKQLVSTNKTLLDKLIAKLGPMGLGAEQIAINEAEQKYPGFWLQTAWPNVWESHATLVDQMMMFLDYRPQTNSTCSFAPKLPAGWSTMTFNNMLYRNHRFDITVTETGDSTRADINKLTTGPLNADIWLRIPASETPAIVIVNGALVAYDYDPLARRVRVQTPLTTAAGNNEIKVTFGDADSDGDGLPDWWEVQFGLDPLDPTGEDGAGGDPDGDGMTNEQEYLAGTDPNDANSAFRITHVTRVNGDTIVTWSSVAGKTYIVQSTDDVKAGYTNLSDPITATGNSTSYTNTTGVAARLYRVRLAP